MKLHSRTQHSNIYDIGDGKRRSVISNHMNVPSNANGDLKPSSNILVRRDHPIVEFLVEQGPFQIGFHHKIRNKYFSAIKLYTGETLTKEAIGDPQCTPTILNKRSIRWEYGNGSWIQEIATECQIKETLFQKAGQTVQFKYKLNGFTVKNGAAKFDIYKGDKVAFSISKPYYMTAENGEFDGWVDYSVEKIDGDYIITYPAPDRDRHIDPTVIFGEGAGYIGGDHKDTFVYAGGANSAWGSEQEIYSGSGGNLAYSIGRWSFDGHIPTSAIISSAIATYKKSLGAGVGLTGTLSYNNILTDFGVTRTDAGINENPPVGANDAATYNNSYHVTGTRWGGGGVIGAADIGVLGDSISINQNDPLGMIYNFDITDIVQSQVQSDANNLGWIISQSAAFFHRMWSLEAAVAANRPHLTVDYTVPSTAVTRQSHIANYIGNAIM